eukprot:TRINITY_DN1897_c0_g1_i2.p1 TRINITY_DN1897_c0_g1~~TRINITY_DN1897_c0_g1_i2.p1  ORF type:complete len:369 (-),score=16.08 TRINITY_DN1897_c0_g1_i2:39-1145(-)
MVEQPSLPITPSNETNKPTYHLSKLITWSDIDPTKFFLYNMAFTFAVDTCFYPLDVVRTRMQVQGSSLHQLSFPHYRNGWEGFKQIKNNEGIWRGLFKGFATCETGYVISHTIYFGVYEIAKQRLQQHYSPESSKDPNLTLFLTTAAAGALADFVQCLFWVPFDIATQRLQLQGPLKKPEYAGGVDVFRKIYGDSKVRGLYKGFGATIIRNVPSSAIWWSTYELSKNFLHWCSTSNIRKKLGLSQRDEKIITRSDGSRVVENEDPLIHLLASMAAGFTSTVLMNPFDVAKTRLQSTNLTISETPSLNDSKGIFNFQWKNNVFRLLLLMVKQEGWRCLMKGLGPALCISLPHSCLAIICYENAKKLAVS